MTGAIRLGVSVSNAAAALAVRGALDVDYIVWYGQIGSERAAELAAHKPLLLHDLSDSFWLNYADPFDDALMTQTRSLLDMMRCPWLSTGIGASAEPQSHRHRPYREANPADVQPRERVIDNIVRHGRRLQAWAGIPLLLENFNFHPTGAYDYICEPALFSELIAAIGCGMLLDLSHARISAQNMRAWGGDVAAYLAALPLETVREIHFNRPGWQRGERVDLHQPVCADDLEWLAWVLDRAPHVEAVTLEIEEMDESALTTQIALLRAWLRAR
jgi:uncharacterized protein (UPF0276 family)